MGVKINSSSYYTAQKENNFSRVLSVKKSFLSFLMEGNVRLYVENDKKPYKNNSFFLIGALLSHLFEKKVLAESKQHLLLLSRRNGKLLDEEIIIFRKNFINQLLSLKNKNFSKEGYFFGNASFVSQYLIEGVVSQIEGLQTLYKLDFDLSYTKKIVEYLLELLSYFKYLDSKFEFKFSSRDMPEIGIERINLSKELGITGNFDEYIKHYENYYKDNVCMICGSKKRLTIHHIIPKVFFIETSAMLGFTRRKSKKVKKLILNKNKPRNLNKLSKNNFNMNNKKNEIKLCEMCHQKVLEPSLNSIYKNNIKLSILDLAIIPTRLFVITQMIKYINSLDIHAKRNHLSLFDDKFKEKILMNLSSKLVEEELKLFDANN